MKRGDIIGEKSKKFLLKQFDEQLYRITYNGF
jgi:hypothetical protein